MCHLQSIERPTVLRDREAVLKALMLALLGATYRVQTDPTGSLAGLAREFVRDLSAHGVELRKRRAVRP